jgi:hypothetical protein
VKDEPGQEWFDQRELFVGQIRVVIRVDAQNISCLVDYGLPFTEGRVHGTPVFAFSVLG